MSQRELRLWMITLIPGALSSCSGEELKIQPCLVGRNLAFELGDVPSWFGIRIRPRPSRITVWKQSSENRPPEWYVQPDLDSQAARRSIIYYGEKLKGLTVEIPAKILQPGSKYRAAISAGANSGVADFTLAMTMPRCSTQDRT